MRGRLGPAIFLAVVILSAAWPVLAGQRFAFRDGNHFYLPLYDYVAERTSADWLPLWNPLDHCGMPLVGESSTAVLYPIRFLVYQLPLSSEGCLNAYLVLHLLIASASAAWLARRIGCTRLGVLVAGIVYPLSGSVFSLCINPPFLVGAAWIPIALGGCLAKRPGQTDRRLYRPIATVALAFSMMILGGDPQSALHCALVIGALAVAGVCVRFFNARSGKTDDESDSPIRALKIGVFASVLAIGICAIQVAASVDWGSQSERTNGLDRRIETYSFSLGPWHVSELFSARPLGHPFPVNRRVAAMFPGEGRMWTPSIYAGLLVGFALLCRLLKPRSYFSEPWFLLSIVSLLLCFGHFGFVWMLQQIPGVLPNSDSAIGGPYWLLTRIVPGYESFRYPIKWLPIFAIASTMVAAQWISTSPAPHERYAAIGLAVTLIVGLGVSHWINQSWQDWRIEYGYGVPFDEYWGPVNLVSATALIRSSCLISLLVLMAIFYLRRAMVYSSSVSADATNQVSLKLMSLWLVVVAADCVWNASTLLPTIDIETERRIASQAAPPPTDGTRYMKTQFGLWPERWRVTDSPDRALETAVSERMAWFGRWHLADRKAVFNSMVSIRSQTYAEFWSELQSLMSRLDEQQKDAFWDAFRRWVAIDGVSLVNGKLATVSEGLTLVNVDRRKADTPIRPIRVATDWKPKLPASQLMKKLVSNDQTLQPHVSLPPPGNEGPIDTETSGLQWSVQAVDRVLIRNEIPCVLERCVFQDGNWYAELQSSTTGNSDRHRVVASSLFNQAVLIPPGDWQVRFVYRPWWKWPAIWVSFVSIVIWCLIVCQVRIRDFSPTRP